jgi:hypothetical protein
MVGRTQLARLDAPLGGIGGAGHSRGGANLLVNKVYRLE